MKKLFAVAVAIMVLTTCALAAFSDMPEEGSWSYNALSFAVENELLTGTDSGKLDPNGKLTRVQLAAIMNRAFGASTEADVSGYSDLKDGWTSSQIAKAVQMGILSGYADHTMRPNDYVTREQVFVVLGRAILLAQSSDNGAALQSKFSDANQVGDWSRNMISAMVESGYVHGNNGKLDPKSEITRAQFAQLVYNIFTRIVTDTGTDTFSNSGSAVIRTGDVTLKNCVIDGDLIIADGAGEKDVTLDGVTVTGRLVVRGGADDTVRVINKSAVSGGIFVCKTAAPVHIDWQSTIKNSPPDVKILEGSQAVTLTGSYGTVALEGDGLTASAKTAKIQKGIIAGNDSTIIVDQSSTLGYGEIAGGLTESTIVVTNSSGKETTITGKQETVTYTPTTTTSSGGGGSSVPTLTEANITGLQFELAYSRPGTSNSEIASAVTSGTLSSTIDLNALQSTDTILSGKIATTTSGITFTYHQYYSSSVSFNVGTDYSFFTFMNSFQKVGPAATVQAVSNYIKTIRDLGYNSANEFARVNSDGSVTVLGYLTAAGYSGTVPYNITIVPLNEG